MTKFLNIWCICGMIASPMKLPYDKDLLDSGQRLIERGAVRQVIFSDQTYQVEVFDNDEAYWPFMQVSDEGHLGDCFCSCEQAEDGACRHQVAAALQILAEGVPLHVLFKNSLWNHLCQIASRRHGYEIDCIHKDGNGDYACTSVTGKRLFELHPKTDRGVSFLREIIENRPVETEETSLKFSNLTPDELERWREGRPDHHLQYELSFWSDLAKGLLLRQVQKDDYKVLFAGGEPPREIHAEFTDFNLKFYVAEVNWNEVIPALTTVHAPVPVYELLGYEIESISYNETLRQFIIQANKRKTARSNAPIYDLGSWQYQPGVAIYPKQTHDLIEGNIVPPSKVAAFLDHHRPLLQRYIAIESIPTPMQFYLEFDQHHSLHIRAYLFEPEDISTTFDHWAYIPDKGFYKVEGQIFEGNEQIILKANLSDFVNRHRIWLSRFEGFEIHLGNIEAHLTYTFDRDGNLCFESESEFFDDTNEIIDLGEWVYIRERGFYPQRQGRGLASLHSGLKVPAKEVAYFIRAHREELEAVQNFFTTSCPVAKLGLNIVLDHRNLIQTDPEVFYTADYRPEQVKLFNEFAYVAGEGFSEIPADLQLPEGYTQPRSIEKKSENYFINYELESLRKHILYLDPRLSKPAILKLTISDIAPFAEGGLGQFAVDLSYETELGMIDVARIWDGLQNKQSYLFTEAGLINLREARFNWLQQIPKNRFIKGGRRIVLTTLEWIRLGVFEEVHVAAAKGEARELLDELLNLQTSKALDLTGLKSTLRPYQEKGVQWLWFLYCHGLSGLLCDDMGLGKTHQAMALIAAVKNACPNSKFLVICPTSVIYHWEELLKSFLPNLTVHCYYGPQRKLQPFEHTDLLLTSYGTYRSDVDMIGHLPIEVAVLDELQVAKNPSSQTHKALRKLEAKVRVALSGTPIENRLLELKALFDIVLPTYFPSDKLYRDFFIAPIEKENDSTKKMLLAKLIHPFLLRRKKSEVLLDLPEKIEEIAYCDLSPDQKELYKAAVYRERDALLHDIEQVEHPVPFLHIFALFSRLKQICDHPSLITGNPYTDHHSGKWDLFIELLSEVRDSGQKLVVFSQYLDMLDIIEHYLTSKSIGFAAIRGTTRDRKEQLAKFRTDPQCEVFVASLQAAGVGIDLTAASVVIHFDRWWNPARENQATDRVHRIGQKRGVQVFKFVTKGTIEEHIHSIIERKKALTEELITYDDQDQIKQLQRNELIQILRSMNPE